MKIRRTPRRSRAPDPADATPKAPPSDRVSSPVAEDQLDKAAPRRRLGSTAQGRLPAASQVAELSATEQARLATLEGAIAAGVTKVGGLEDPALAREFRADLINAYYPVDHPNLHVSDEPLNLNRIGGVGRKDETGRLKKVALAPPYALGGEWRFSPMAQAKGFEFDLDSALRQHVALTEFFLERGVQVYLQVHPAEASEAVYATDTVTGIGKTALIGNPKHDARKLETKAYTGGVRLERFGGEAGPIEFGDVQLFEKDGVQYVFQGFNSWRGTKKSIQAMDEALADLQARGLIGAYVHVPVELSGDGTLHLDYVFSYAGEGDQRVMLIHEEGLKDPKMVQRLADILDVPDERVIRVDKEQMFAGAANLSSFDPSEVLYIDNEHTRPVAEKMRSFGLKVTAFPYSQMSQKDGTLHCSIGQLQRA